MKRKRAMVTVRMPWQCCIHIITTVVWSTVWEIQARHCSELYTNSSLLRSLTVRNDGSSKFCQPPLVVGCSLVNRHEPMKTCTPPFIFYQLVPQQSREGCWSLFPMTLGKGTAHSLDSGGNMNTQSESKPRIFLLWGDSVNHCTAMGEMFLTAEPRSWWG